MSMVAVDSAMEADVVDEGAAWGAADTKLPVDAANKAVVANE